MAFKVINQPQAPQMNLPTSLLRGILNPLRRTAGQGVELGFDIGEKLGIGDRSKAVNPFLNTEESQQLNSGAGNYATQTLRNLAGIGANVVPVGKGAGLVRSAVVPGAVSGGLQAFGENSNVATGAVGGGIFGGILGKLLGAGANPALKETGKKLFGEATPTITGAALEATPGFSSSREGLQKLASEIGITDAMPSLKKASLIDTTFDAYQNRIGSLLKESEAIPTSVIQQNLVKNFRNSNITDPKSGVVELVLEKIRNAAGDNVKLNALKSEARKEMGNLFTGGASTPKKDAWELAYNTIKDSLDTVSPEIRAINNKQHGLFDLAKEFVPSAKKATEAITLGIPGTNASIPTPATKEGFSNIMGRLGKLITSPVTVPANAALTAAERLPAADSSLGGALLSAGSRLPALASGMQGEQQPDTVPQGGISQLAAPQPQRQVPGQDDMLGTLLQLGVASGDITPTAAKFILEQKGGGKKTEAQVARDSLSNSISTAIQQLKTTNPKTGMISPRIESIKSNFNMGDQATLDFDNSLAQIKASIAKARAGTSFTPNEEALLNKYAPVDTDSKQKLETKLKGLQLVFDNHDWNQGAGSALDVSSLQDLLGQ